MRGTPKKMFVTYLIRKFQVSGERSETYREICDEIRVRHNHAKENRKFSRFLFASVLGHDTYRFSNRCTAGSKMLPGVS